MSKIPSIASLSVVADCYIIQMVQAYRCLSIHCTVKRAIGTCGKQIVS